MILRNVVDGDWTFGAGKQNYLRDNNAISLNIETTLKTFLGECFFAPDFGLPWFDLIDSKNKDIIILYVKAAISDCYGVLNVQEVEYSFNELRELEIKYTISTIYEKTLQGVINI